MLTGCRSRAITAPVSRSPSPVDFLLCPNRSDSLLARTRRIEFGSE